jgi:hypothetical protein
MIDRRDAVALGDAIGKLAAVFNVPEEDITNIRDICGAPGTALELLELWEWRIRDKHQRKVFGVPAFDEPAPEPRGLS